TYGSGATAGMVTSTALTRNSSSTAVQKLTYVYYGSGDANGSAGDVELVISTADTGAAPVVTYMRYYTNSSGDQVKYIIQGNSFDRLALATSVTTQDPNDGDF